LWQIFNDNNLKKKKIMKKKLLYAFVALMFLSNAVFSAVVDVTSAITSNTTWTSNNTYVLKGFIYVKNNAKLTIESGTIIKGDKQTKGTLIITRGSQIIADGLKTSPIVFTSNQPVGQRSYGDWGGLIILGKAPVNQGEVSIEGGVDNASGDGKYGGTDVNDNSGILRYVRIEFAGIAFQPDNEINGLTMGGVGAGTTIDYVQVSYSGDDSFEFFGGTVVCKHLIAFKGLDDDFDTDFGYSGRIQFALSIRDPKIADVSSSNGFESDNDASGSDKTPNTTAKISNFTLIGPKETASSSINSLYKRGAHIRRNSRFSLHNGIIMGWPTGIYIDSDKSAQAMIDGNLNVKNCIIAGCDKNYDKVTQNVTLDILGILSNGANIFLTNNTDVMLNAPFNYTAPNLIPKTGSPALIGASFSGLTEFEQVLYIGAFGSDVDWTAGWTNWNPVGSDIIAYAGADQLVCKGDSVKLIGTAVGLPQGATATYLWSNGSSTIGSTSTLNVKTSVNTTYYLTITYGGNTVVDNSVISVTTPNFEWNHNQADSSITFNNKTNFYGNIYFSNSSGTKATWTYAWDFGDGNTSSEKSPNHQYNSAGTYNVKLVIGDGANICDDSIAKTLVIYPLSVSEVNFGVNSFNVYPVPVNNEINIELDADYAGEINVNIIDMYGKQIINTTENLNKTAILNYKTDSFSKGVYFINISNSKGMISKKFIKM